jgi:hypothetical protein
MLEFEIIAPNSGRRSLHTLYIVKGTLRDGAPVLKVGRTRDLDRRLASLAINGMGDPLLLVHVRDSHKVGVLEGIWKRHVASLPGLHVHRGELVSTDDGYTEVLRVGPGADKALDAVFEKVHGYAARYGVTEVTA